MAVSRACLPATMLAMATYLGRDTKNTTGSNTRSTETDPTHHLHLTHNPPHHFPLRLDSTLKPYLTRPLNPHRWNYSQTRDLPAQLPRSRSNSSAATFTRTSCGFSPHCWELYLYLPWRAA
jgi:hypothetical protein